MMQILKTSLELNKIQARYNHLKAIFYVFNNHLTSNTDSLLSQSGVAVELLAFDENKTRFEITFLDKTFFIAFDLDKFGEEQERNGILEFLLQVEFHGKMKTKRIFKQSFNGQGVLTDWKTQLDDQVDIKDRDTAQLFLLNWIEKYFNESHPIEHAFPKHRGSD